MFVQRRLFSALVFAVLCLLSACSSVRHIREAQDSFNRAAQVELEEARLDAGRAADAVATSPSAAREYAAALALLRRELSENADALAADKLTGTALMLEALCVWRLESLGQLERSTSGFNEAMKKLAEHREELGTRDQVLSIALPGLRENDEGYERLEREKAKPRDQIEAGELTKARDLFESAYAQLDLAIKEVQPHDSHPIHAFVRVSQLRVCVNWKQALEADTSLSAQQQQTLVEDVRQKFCASWKTVPAKVVQTQSGWWGARSREAAEAAGWLGSCEN